MRINGLDGLRALSIMLVLVAHLAEQHAWAHFGGFGVEVFFSISGFLITHLLIQEQQRNGSVSIRSFYARRAFRILPPAIVFLGAVLVIARFGYADASGRDALYSLLFVRNLFGNGLHTGHFWSLSIEEQFYVLWPTMFVLLRSNTKRLLLVTALIAVYPAWYFYRLHHGANNMAFDVRCIYLLAGCGLALARGHSSLKGVFVRLEKSRSGIMVCSVTAVVFALSPFFPIGCLAGTVCALSVALIINAVIGHSKTFLDAQPIVWLGQLSYSLYLWQQLFCYRSDLPVFGRFPLNVFATLAMAYASYELIERPALKWRGRLMSKHREPNSPAGPVAAAGVAA